MKKVLSVSRRPFGTRNWFNRPEDYANYFQLPIEKGKEELKITMEDTTRTEGNLRIIYKFGVKVMIRIGLPCSVHRNINEFLGLVPDTIIIDFKAVYPEEFPWKGFPLGAWWSINSPVKDGYSYENIKRKLDQANLCADSTGKATGGDGIALGDLDVTKHILHLIVAVDLVNNLRKMTRAGVVVNLQLQEKSVMPLIENRRRSKRQMDHEGYSYNPHTGHWTLKKARIGSYE